MLVHQCPWQCCFYWVHAVARIQKLLLLIVEIYPSFAIGDWVHMVDSSPPLDFAMAMKDNTKTQGLLQFNYFWLTTMWRQSFCFFSQGPTISELCQNIFFYFLLASIKLANLLQSFSKFWSSWFFCILIPWTD